MSSKTHLPLTLTDEEMIDRLRKGKQEDLDGQLVHCTTEAEVREYFAAITSEDS